MTATVNEARNDSAELCGGDVGGHRPRHITSVLSAACREEVQRIVRQAANARQPLSVISTGRNWGLGSGMPIEDGTSMLDLSPMTGIRRLDGDGLATTYPDAGAYRRRFQPHVHCGDR